MDTFWVWGLALVVYGLFLVWYVNQNLKGDTLNRFPGSYHYSVGEVHPVAPTSPEDCSSP